MEHLKGAVIGLAPALPAKIRLCWRGLTGTNTVAYYENLLITDIKSCIVQAPGKLYNGTCFNHFLILHHNLLNLSGFLGKFFFKISGKKLLINICFHFNVLNLSIEVAARSLLEV